MIRRPLRQWLLGELEGGCQVPIGALGRIRGTELQLEAVVASLDGIQTVRMTMTGAWSEAEILGRKLAQMMLKAGAAVILNQIKRETGGENSSG